MNPYIASSSRLAHHVLIILVESSPLLCFFIQSISLLDDVSHCKDICHERALQFTGFDCYQWSFNALSSAFMSLSFFNGDKNRSDSKSLGSPQSRTPRRDFFDGRQWTNMLLAANVL